MAQLKRSLERGNPLARTGEPSGSVAVDTGNTRLVSLGTSPFRVSAA